VTTRLIPVPDGVAGERVDAAVARILGLSRTRAADLVGAGLVLLDGAVVAKSDRVAIDQILEVTIPEEAVRADVPGVPVPGLRVLYADDDLVVVDKPAGVAAHPSPGWTGPTVIGGLTATGYRISTSGASERQGVVHRLDVGTTGVMVVAASEPAYTSLKQQFRERSVDKTYHALVQGHPDPSRGTIDAPIGRHPTHDYRWAVVSDGRPSVTQYETLEAFPHASLLSVDLLTGRTHQIRVHMSAIRHPCVGDLMYGADPSLAHRLGLQRQWLHAVELTIEHPRTGQRMTFTAPYPADLTIALDRIGAA